MSDLKINRHPTPVVTGKPIYPLTGTTGSSQKETAVSTKADTGKMSFGQVLQQQLNQQQVSFSKHATERVTTRSINLSESNLGRLNEGVRLAEQKGLDDTLILIDKTAFVVNVRNRVVITAVNESELNGNVFTNIDGAVVV